VLRSLLSLVVGLAILTAGILGLFASAFPDERAVPSTAFMIFAAIFAFFVAVVAGYVTGLTAGRAEVGHAVALAICVTGGGILFMEDAGSSHATWYQIGTVVLGVGGVILGGYLRARRTAAPARPARAA
jgi:hypothetical protein